MDPYRIIVAVLLLAAGFVWSGLVILDAFDGASDGPLWGWGPLIAGLGVIVAGVLVLIF